MRMTPSTFVFVVANSIIIDIVVVVTVIIIAANVIATIIFVNYRPQCRLNHGPNGPMARAPELQGPRAAGSGNFLLLNFAVKILIDFMALMWL